MKRGVLSTSGGCSEFVVSDSSDNAVWVALSSTSESSSDRSFKISVDCDDNDDADESDVMDPTVSPTATPGKPGSGWRVPEAEDTTEAPSMSPTAKPGKPPAGWRVPEAEGDAGNGHVVPMTQQGSVI